MSDTRSRSQDADHREDADPRAVIAQSAKGLFIANFDKIRSAACKDLAGVALVAVDTRSAGVVGTTWIGRDAERPSSLVVGSHEMCDLVVGEDDAMALRHIAVLVPAGAARPAEFSLHDLHTGQGFTLEDGESALAATVSRFGVVEFGPCMLFCFATGVGGDWSQTAANAWVELSGETKTVYREENSAPKQKIRSIITEHASSYVCSIRGPMRTSDRLLKDGEEHVVELRVEAGDRVDRMALGASALERGVLVGRADRCASILTASRISRVHVLVIAIDGQVVAVDTGSTNGVFRDPEAKVRARVVVLSRGEQAALVDEDASVSVR